MKKRLFCISLLLALVLTIIMPAAAIAQGETYAEGTISLITPGETRPAGNSGRWIVQERDIVIDFTSGELSGTHALRYHASVDTDEENLQACNLQGTLHEVTLDPGTGNPDLGDEVLNVTGTTSPATQLFNIGTIPVLLNDGTQVNIPDPSDPTQLIPAYMDVGMYVIFIEGNWSYINGGVGHGTFDGMIYVLICNSDFLDVGIYLPGIGYNLTNHVVGIYDYTDFPPGFPELDSIIALYD